MDYLMRGRDEVVKFKEVQDKAARGIVIAWQAGELRRTRVANYGIRAVEKKPY